MSKTGLSTERRTEGEKRHEDATTRGSIHLSKRKKGQFTGVKLQMGKRKAKVA